MFTCITVSVNYDNLLNIILPQNQKFFKKWYIVTHENDKKTIDLVNKYNFPNVELVYFDFYKDNRTFNKGGAVNYALNMIPQGENVLLLDSDIFIPDSFEKYIHYELQYDVLYGCDRYDYYSYSNFINDNYDNKYSLNFMGFFQLFKNNKRYAYEDSENCRQCDWDFCYKFPERILLEGIALKHLGRDNVNHFGRKNLDDFMMS